MVSREVKDVVVLEHLELVRAIDYIESLSPADVARASRIVQDAMDYIRRAVSAVRDRALADACLSALEQPEPAFLRPAGSIDGSRGPGCTSTLPLPSDSASAVRAVPESAAPSPASPRSTYVPTPAPAVDFGPGSGAFSLSRGILRRNSHEILEDLVMAGFVAHGCAAADVFPDLPGTTGSSDSAGSAGPSGSADLAGSRGSTRAQRDPVVRLSFEAAAGSTAGQHHAFPGGLALHVASNLRRCLDQAEAYRDIYGTTADEDILIAACVLHDCMKPYVLKWSRDGEPQHEGTIAGEGSHHVLSLAQALVLGVEPAVVVAAASAPRNPSAAREEIAAFVAAACVVAGIEPQTSGAVTREDGGRYVLVVPDRLEHWLVHFSDSDHIFTNYTARVVDKELAGLAIERYGFTCGDLRCARYRRMRNYVLAKLSAERLYCRLTSSGRSALAEDVGAVLKEAAHEARARGGPG